MPLYGIGIIWDNIWDNFAVFRGHWAFPGKGILGIYIGLIPIEEYGFAFVTSYFALIIYKVITKKF